jgi:hypothetical protein
MLYHDITGDVSASDSISEDVQKRIKSMLELEDPNIIFDFRKNNGFKGSKFDIFWAELQDFFNEVFILIIL